MTGSKPIDADPLSLSAEERIDQACLAFEDAWKAGQRPPLEDVLSEACEDDRQGLLRELLLIEIAYRRQLDEKPSSDEYLARFPEHAAVISAALQRALGVSPDPNETDVWSGLDDSKREKTLPHVTRLGTTIADRYAVKKVLGAGAFGQVYLGHDQELDRPVAIKVLHAAQIGSSSAAVDLQQEARTLAALRHPAIVSVHDIGSDEGGDLFVVMDFIAGTSLQERLPDEPLGSVSKPISAVDRSAIKTYDPEGRSVPAAVSRSEPRLPRQRLSLNELVRGLTTVAEAIHHAHTEGVFHRDLKPANILIDVRERFHVADFGLAIRESSKHRLRGSTAGTPFYMAPEQVRRETHRVGPGTDVWAIGVILYQVLCDRLPFAGEDRDDLFDQIRHQLPERPSSLQADVPRELERICLKCLAKRIDDRYGSAKQLAEELESWLRAPSVEPGGSERVESAARVIPRGLRPFSQDDRAFYLDLIPGPRTRDDLPESVDFWKSRIDSLDRELAFDCGVMYGPSGCGKTSFVKAGILPLIADHVVTIYVEAAPGVTESRLLGELYRQCPALDEDLSLVEACTQVRRGTGLPYGQKVVIFIDQFEQWLQEHREDESPELADALRQCDGAALQCIIMVRDDFWLATTRFLQLLEVPLVDGENFRLIDVFDGRHARHVLTEFGRSYGCLPRPPAALEPGHRKFLDQTVQELTEDGRVVPVRLSLFAEMTKGKTWQPQTLRRYGGAEGLGIAFLEEAFDSQAATPINRKHNEAAKSVLGQLLPEPGSELKGRMQSLDTLREKSGYAEKPADFDELLQILDGQLRLVTPTEGIPSAVKDAAGEAATSSRFYQLTHDYLVRPIRRWLDQQQRETWRGRAKLVLSERAAQWRNTPERRHLPTLPEYVSIVAGVPRNRRTQSEQKLVSAAHSYYGCSGLAIAALLAAITITAWYVNGRFHGRRVADTLRVATPAEFPGLLAGDLARYRDWSTPYLRRILAEPGATEEEKLRASLALVSFDAGQVSYLKERLYHASLDEFPLVRDALDEHVSLFEAELWSTLRSRDANDSRRLRAGLALAASSHESPTWSVADAQALVEMMLAIHPDQRHRVRDWLQPIHRHLRQPLHDVFVNENKNGADRVAAAVSLSEYEADAPEFLAELLTEANPPQFSVLLTKLLADKPADEVLVRVMTQRLQQAPDDQLSESQKSDLGKQHANCAAALLHLNRITEALTFFDSVRNVELTTQFAHRARELQVSRSMLLSALDQASDADARFAVLLALGKYDPPAASSSDHAELLQRLQSWTTPTSDSGVHAAADQLLSRWFTDEIAGQAAGEPSDAPDFGRREWNTQSIAGEATTFVRIPAGQFQMGSPPTENQRSRDERRHLVEIHRPFAISDREITRNQFQAFLIAMRRLWPQVEDVAPTPQHAMVGVKWREAVMFCRWITEQAGMAESDQCYEKLEDWQHSAEGIPIDVVFRPDRRGYRLPTEAEWEYACRGGSRDAYSFGSDPYRLPDYAWFLDNSTGTAHLPKQRLPNRRGLFDMHGNVLEWCQDVYGSYQQAEATITGVRAETTNRLLRGGSWHQYPGECRAAYRQSETPNQRLPGHGFRIVLTMVE